MENIYELTQGIQLLWDLMEEGAIDDNTLIDAMMNSQEELSIKLEGYAKFIKNMESDIEGLKAEEKRLASRRKTLENTIDRAKAAIKFAMNTAGLKKSKGDLFTVSVQANPKSVVVDEQYIENIPQKYLIPQEPKIDKKLMKEDIENGVDLEGVAHLEQTESVRIR